MTASEIVFSMVLIRVTVAARAHTMLRYTSAVKESAAKESKEHRAVEIFGERRNSDILDWSCFPRLKSSLR